MSEPMMWLLVRGVWETLAMTFVSGFFGFVIGLPVGVLLYVYLGNLTPYTLPSLWAAK